MEYLISMIIILHARCLQYGRYIVEYRFQRVNMSDAYSIVSL